MFNYGDGDYGICSRRTSHIWYARLSMARQDDPESQQQKTETVSNTCKIDPETAQDVCSATYSDKENGTCCSKTYANFEIIVMVVMAVME